MDDDGPERREEEVAQRLEDVAPSLAHLQESGQKKCHSYLVSLNDVDIRDALAKEKPCLIGDLPTHLCSLRGEYEDARGEHERECEAGGDRVALQVEEERREDVRRLQFMGIQCFN